MQCQIASKHPIISNVIIADFKRQTLLRFFLYIICSFLPTFRFLNLRAIFCCSFSGFGSIVAAIIMVSILLKRKQKACYLSCSKLLSKNLNLLTISMGYTKCAKQQQEQQQQQQQQNGVRLRAHVSGEFDS